ncbi:peptidase M16 domain-containing protein [Brucella pinnipedialis M163/99/10]|nr:peptidase M16 domain-containing protein [Brucella pinnipedialis M163/99/10]
MMNLSMSNFKRAFPLRGALHDARAVAGLLAASFTMLIVCALPARAIEIQEVVSPKGIHAWLVEDNSVPLVSMRFSFKGGASQDPSGKEGIANLMTGLFDEGAGDLDSDAFQERIDNLGAEMSFSASQDSVSGGVRMLAENRDAGPISWRLPSTSRASIRKPSTAFASRLLQALRPHSAIRLRLRRASLPKCFTATTLMRVTMREP